MTVAELPRSSASRAGAEVEVAGTPHPTPRTYSSPHEDLCENTLPRIEQDGEARIATLSKPLTNIVHSVVGGCGPPTPVLVVVGDSTNEIARMSRLSISPTLSNTLHKSPTSESAAWLCYALMLWVCGATITTELVSR